MSMNNKILSTSLLFALTGILAYFLIFNEKENPESKQVSIEETSRQQTEKRFSVVGDENTSPPTSKEKNSIDTVTSEEKEPTALKDGLEPVFTRELDFSSSLLNQFESLKKSADEGNIEDAFRLGQLLQACAFEPKTQEEYDQTITDQLTIPVESINSGFEFCKGITKKQLKLSTFYLDKAAKAGDIEAQLSFFRALPLEIDGYGDNYEPNSKNERDYIADLNDRRIRYLESAVNEGSIDAALQLSLSYSNDLAPTITGHDLSKAIKYATLGSLMDHRNDSQSKAFLDFLLTQASVDEGEQATRSAQAIFSQAYQGKTFFIFKTKRAN